MSDKSRSTLGERLSCGTPLVLDAAMGSDLDRRGLPTTLPLWSAVGLLKQPDLVRRIHLDNLLAGAEIITTDTFRTTAHTLRKAGIDPARAPELDALAVRLAAEARAEAGRPEAWIAGSIAPPEDCYLPTLRDTPELALAEHRAQAANLAAAGVDLIMVETIPTVAEAEIALRAAVETGRPAMVGFVCAMPDRGEPVRLLSGETLNYAVDRVSPLGPTAIFVNCAAPPVITAALEGVARTDHTPYRGVCQRGSCRRRTRMESGRQHHGRAVRGARGGVDRRGSAGGRRLLWDDPAHTAALRRLIDTLPAD